MTNKIIKILNIFFLLTCLISCNGGKMSENKNKLPNIKDVPVTKWEKLAQKKIYFGHQSVGYNIIEGINELMKENPQIKLNIVETSKQADFKVSLFAHSKLGNNEDPISKIKEFSSYINKGLGNNADIASIKFCFVDIYSTTNINSLFNNYKNSMFILKKEYPKTTFVHFTIPLLRKEKSSFKTGIKKLLGKKDSFFDNSHNIARNNFNALLRKEYIGKEPIFDIAKIESIHPNGEREVFKKNGKVYYSLVPEYTEDGGHLNEVGRKIVAEQLLIFLSTL